MKMQQFFKKNWLFWLNFIIFQWFFVRFGAVTDPAKKYVNERGLYFNKYALVFPIIPLTGWKTDFKPYNVQVYVLERDA